MENPNSGKKINAPTSDTGTFDFTIDSGEGQQVLDNGTDGYGNGDSTGAVDVSAGDHTVSESGNGATKIAGYASTWSCSSNKERSQSGTGTSISLGNLTLSENVTCTFTNTKLATLIVKKVVNNSNGGGTKGPGDFSIHVTAAGLELPGSPAAGSGTGTTYSGLMPPLLLELMYFDASPAAAPATPPAIERAPSVPPASW